MARENDLEYPPQRVRRMLVVAPHADDEVVGCGGTILKAATQSVRVDVVVMGLGGIRHRHLSDAVSDERRRAELAASNKRLGVHRCDILFAGREMRLAEIPLLDVVSALDRVLDQGYDEIYLPPYDHNSDHRVTHEAALAALRPGARQSPTLVAVYESVSSSWAAPAPAGSLYVDISNHLEAKLEALRCHACQIRDYPHPLSLEAVRRLAAFRGAESGSGACERFSILRMMR